MQLPIPDADAASGVQSDALTLQDFIAHLIPTSIVDAMARNEILQIVVFSLFFGTAHGGARRAQPRPSSTCSTPSRTSC